MDSIFGFTNAKRSTWSADNILDGIKRVREEIGKIPPPPLSAIYATPAGTALLKKKIPTYEAPVKWDRGGLVLGAVDYMAGIPIIYRATLLECLLAALDDEALGRGAAVVDGDIIGYYGRARQFAFEEEARAWKKDLISNPGSLLDVRNPG